MNGWATIPLAWLGCDLLHRTWIAARRARWERGQRRGPDGVREEAHAFACGEGDTALLCIHGFADIPPLFRAMAQDLTAGGAIHCRAMRLPGAGEPLARAARVTLADWLAAIASEARALRRRHARLWLLGHSLGGALALATVLHEPGLADGIALLAPMLRVSRARSPLLPPHLWFRMAQATFLFSRTFESCFSSEVVAAAGGSYRRDRFIPFATYRNLFALAKWLQPRASLLSLPLCARLVAEDKVVDTPAAARWLAATASQRRDIRVLSGGDHAIPTGPSWNEVTAELRSFMLTSCR